MDKVIKKRGQNEYGMNLYRRGDVLQYVGKVEELIRKVRMIEKRCPDLGTAPDKGDAGAAGPG